MKKWLVTLMLLALAAPAFAATARQDSEERLRMASGVLQQVMSAPDKGIPSEVIDNAKCLVVVPHLVKVGVIVGGKHGRGVATCRTAGGWSAPAFISTGGASAGLQIGAEGVDLVMVVMNDRGLQHLLANKLELTGEGSVAAGPVGRHASAGTDWTMNTEVLTYSRSKGAFAGLTLEGAVVEKDDDSTIAIYGRNAGFRSILAGDVPAPAVTQGFMKIVDDVSAKAHAHENADKD